MSTQRRTPSFGAILLMLLVVIVIPFLPPLITRDWDWWEAWVYGIVAVGGFVVSRLLVARRHPDLHVERARITAHDDVEP